jgi:hypothetical protein
MKVALGIGCVALLVGVACSSKSGGGGASSATTASAFGAQFCQLLEPCCAAAGLSTAGTICQIYTQTTASEGTYDAANGQACLAGSQQESSAGTFCTTLGSDIPACAQVFTPAQGTVQPGQPCQQDSDCAVAAGGGAICFLAVAIGDGGSAQTQTCVQTQPGTAGQGPCIGEVEATGTVASWTGSGSPPAQAYLCATSASLTCSSTTQQCTPLAALGQPCTQDTDCVTGAYCTTGSSGTNLVCTADLADGASCAFAVDGCLPTSYCDPATTTCTATLPDGSACTSDQQCSSYVCTNDSCGGTSSELGLTVLCGTN